MSAMVFWNPRVVLDLWSLLKNKDWPALEQRIGPVRELHNFLDSEYTPKGFTDTAYDRMGAVTTGFLKTSLRNRGPYRSATESDVKTMQQWYHEHYPEMLEL